MLQPNIKKITNFIFELNQLKRQKNIGFKLCGVKDPYSTADHIWRAAQIGYILAELEKADAEKVVSIILIHDNGETRVSDQHKVAARYYSKKEAEEKSFNDQLDGLGETIAKKWKKYSREFELRNTPEGIIAKDADWLEQAFQAKEYMEIGYPMVENWIANVEKALETASAKRIIKQMKKTGFTDWWQGLKKMTYKKLYR